MKCVKCPDGEVFKVAGEFAGHCKTCFYKAKNAKFKDKRAAYYKARRAADPEYCERANAASRKHRATERGKKWRSSYKAARAASEAGERDRVRQRAYYQERRKERIQNANRWKRENPERAREHARRSSKRRQQNPLKAFADRIRRELRRLCRLAGVVKRGKTFDLMGVTPAEAHEALVGRYCGKPCVVCKSVVVTVKNSHIDHIIPASTARTFDDVVRLSELSNLRLICPGCNIRKGNKVESDAGRGEEVDSPGRGCSG